VELDLKHSVRFAAEVRVGEGLAISIEFRQLRSPWCGCERSPVVESLWMPGGGSGQ
jgi:hypothetical protein